MSAPAAEPAALAESETSIAKHEPWYSIVLQIVFPYMFASIGTITAGIIMGNVQNWKVFKSMNELFALVPALCGLKGNLDMCVASRLSTLANMGILKKRSNIRQIVLGNVALVQVQAIVSSFILAIFMVFQALIGQNLILYHFVTLTASTLITATTSCIILDSVLIFVILVSLRFRFNPDYMATPIVASIGDVFSISLLAFTTAFLYDLGNGYQWISVLVMVIYLILLLPFWVFIVLRNIYIRPILFNGWKPVFAALCISQVGGYVLSWSVHDFSEFAVFVPIINGNGGNLVSVYTSHMGTLLYQRAELGNLPEGIRVCESPQNAVCYGTIYVKVSRVLIIIAVPGTCMQVYMSDFLYRSKTTVHFIFVIAYLFTSLLQLFILLWLAYCMVHRFWQQKIDPDSAAIPYLTAIGDSLGTSFLALMFYALKNTNYY